MEKDAPHTNIIPAPPLALPGHEQGPITGLFMEPSGGRLAVTCQGASSIGLYKMTLDPLPLLKAMGPLDGPDEKPSVLAWSQQQPSVLATVWTMGTVSFSE